MNKFLLPVISLFFVTGCIASDSNCLFTQQDVFVSGRDNVANYRIPALLTTPTGVVIAVCDARKDRGGDLPNNVDSVIKRSLDNGKTWSDMQVIADYPGTRGACNQILFYDKQTKTLWAGYTYANEGVGWSKSGKNNPGYGDDTLHIYLHQSKDDGLTWSKPIDVTKQIKPAELIACWIGPGIGIQLRSGRLVFGFITMADNTDRRFEGMDSWIAYSDDNGQTWKSSRAGIGAEENQFVELNDGRLMAVMRVNPPKKGKRVINYSNDGGQTWGKQFESDILIDPRCQASIFRYRSTKDGDANDIILYASPANAEKRVNMTVRASFDEGKTWPVAKTINADYSAYSCLTKLADGNIGLLYERNTFDKDNKKKHTITFARFSLEWLIGSQNSQVK